MINDPDSSYRNYLEKIFPLVEREIFTYDKPFTQLNFPEKGGVTAYFSSNMKSEDLDLVREFLRAKDIDPLNTRAFKKDDSTYEITVGSIEKGLREYEFKDRKFKVINGEFGVYLEEVIYYLEKAR